MTKPLARPARVAAWTWALSGAVTISLLSMTPVVGPNYAAAVPQPGAISYEEALSLLAEPIAVPSGETVYVDIGWPVNVAFAADGWEISAEGNQIKVTAPPEGGAQAEVPIEVQGTAATVTLLADDSMPVPPPAEEMPAELPAEEPAAPPPAPPADSDPWEAPLLPAKERAEEVDTEGAETLDLEARIEGSTITAQLGLRQGARLMEKFQGVDQQSVTVRYLDGHGNLINNVRREIDVPARTLTLIYPEHQPPDNPFIIQVVRDGSAILMVRLTDPEKELLELPQQEPAQEQPAAAADSYGLMAGIIGVVALVAVVAVGVRRWRRQV